MNEEETTTEEEVETEDQHQEDEIVENPAEETTASDDSDNSETDDTTEEQPEKPKRKSGVHKRINKLTREKYELQARIKELENSKPEPKADAPKAENFDSYEDYLSAKTRHEAQQAVNEQMENQKKEKAQQAEQNYQKALMESWEDKTEDARDKYDDYDEVVNNEDIQITPVMGMAIMETDQGADIAYYLGNNPDEADRISKLTPTRQQIEIGKLEVKVSQLNKKTVTPSKAPEPIKPVGNKNQAEKDPDSMTTDEWMEAERKRMAKKAG